MKHNLHIWNANKMLFFFNFMLFVWIKCKRFLFPKSNPLKVTSPLKLRLPKAANSENNEVATIGTLRYHFKEVSFSSERVGVMNQSIALVAKVSNDGLVHFTDPQPMDYHEWTTEMDYLNGRLNGLPKWTTLYYLLWKKKKIIKAWLFWTMHGCLRHLGLFFFLYAAGQLFYRCIHSSRVMADTLGGE